jgi:hypothetical protein
MFHLLVTKTTVELRLQQREGLIGAVGKLYTFLFCGKIYEN